MEEPEIIAANSSHWILFLSERQEVNGLQSFIGVFDTCRRTKAREKASRLHLLQGLINSLGSKDPQDWEMFVYLRKTLGGKHNSATFN